MTRKNLLTLTYDEGATLQSIKVDEIGYPPAAHQTQRTVYYDVSFVIGNSLNKCRFTTLENASFLVWRLTGADGVRHLQAHP